MARRIMIVDDEAAIRESLAEALADQPGEVQTAADGKQALELLSRGAPDIGLTDVRMPEMDGLALLREIRQRVPQRTIWANGSDHRADLIRDSQSKIARSRRWGRTRSLLVHG